MQYKLYGTRFDLMLGMKAALPILQAKGYTCVLVHQTGTGCSARQNKAGRNQQTAVR